MTIEFLLPTAGNGIISGGFDLYQWGDNLYGIGNGSAVNQFTPQQIGALSDWAQVSAGTYNCLAIKTNGTIWSWGRNTSGELGDGTVINKSSPVQIGALSNWAQVATGSQVSLAIKTDGTLWAWGNGFAGALGDGTSISKSSPVQIGALTNWAQVSVGRGTFSVAVKTDGTLWSWGTQGIAFASSSNSPVQIGALTNWSKVSAGFSYALLVKTDGTLWAWGNNTNGELGNNTIVNTSSPVQIGALTDWAQVSASGCFGIGQTAHSLAVKTNGTLWAWGTNANGELGDNTIIKKSSPVQIGALTDWAQVSAGTTYSLAIKTNGTLWAWGSNSTFFSTGTSPAGQIGDGTAIYRSSPVQVGSLSNWSKVSASSIGNNGSEDPAISLAVTTTGRAYAWGQGLFGSSGLNQSDVVSPTFVGSAYTSVGNGYGFSVAVRGNGSLWSWGRNDTAQCGTNNAVFSPLPVQVGALTDWAQVASGAYNTLAIKTNGTLWGWGLNTGGQLGDNTVITRSSPVQIGALSNWAQVATGSQRSPIGIFSVAVKTDGTLWTWGQDSEGQLGKSTRGINTSSPVQIGALSNWAQVSAGCQFVLARKTDGTLWAWGVNSSGNLGDNTTFVSKSSPIQIGALSNWAQVSAGGVFTFENFSLAVKTDGTLWAWGNNTRGQLGDNAAITKSSPVQIGALTNWSKVQVGTVNESARGGFSVAVKTDGTLWTWGFNPNGQLGDNTIITKSSPVQIGALTGWEKPNNMPGSGTAGALF